MTYRSLSARSSSINKTVAARIIAIKRKLAPSTPPVPDNYPADEISGFCTLCGSYGRFVRAHPAIRESYWCEACGASARERHQAEVILDRFSKHGSGSIKTLVREAELQALNIYELTLKGRFSRYLRQLPRYTQSYYWDDVPTGEYRDGVQCQDVMSLTYADDSFDLIISSDVFEHVRRPLAGFREIARVLKPGGVHCWTVPTLHPVGQKTHYRVDTSGSRDIFIDAPRYHGDGAGGKSLVYTDFGKDICEELQKFGMETEVIRAKSESEEASRIVTFFSIKVNG